jgi:hypothetical protein
VLSPLAAGVVFTVSGLAQAAGGIERKVARMAAEELRALGIAACPVEDSSEWDDPGREAAGRRDWQLADTELADLAQTVLCGTKSGDHPPIPPRDRARRSPLISTDTDIPHSSSHCPTQLTTEGGQS